MNQPRRQAWFALGVLFAINMMNFYDRQIIAAVTEPIRREWDLTDTDMGILGTAFVLIYAAVGVPLGRLSDRWSRTRILSGGVTVWSLLTAVSGATWNYRLDVRGTVGCRNRRGELHAAANSLVGDLFPPHQRGRALSIFMLGLPLGIFFSNWLSGTIVQCGRLADRVLRGLRSGTALRRIDVVHSRTQARSIRTDRRRRRSAATSRVSVSSGPRHADNRVDHFFRRAA